MKTSPVTALSKLAEKAQETTSAIIFKFSDKPGCTLETTDPDVGYFISMWISDRLKFEDLIRVLYTLNENYSAIMIDFVKGCSP